MLQLKSFSVDHDRPMMPPCGFSPDYFHYAFGFLTPKYSHTSQTPWSVFQDGRFATILSASCCFRSRRSSNNAPQPPSCHYTRPNWHLRFWHVGSPCRRWYAYKPQLGSRGKYTQTNTGRKPFPFNDFRYYLTLFSKFFSSFVHTTCSLSVSRQYLAFDGIYHQLWAAVPSNSTLWKQTVRFWFLSHEWDSHPLWMPCSKGLEPRPKAGATSIDYNSY